MLISFRFSFTRGLTVGAVFFGLLEALTTASRGFNITTVYKEVYLL